MSLDKFKFDWTPPETLERAPRAASVVPEAEQPARSTVALPPVSETNCGRLIESCRDWQATAKYLADVVLKRSAGLSLNIVPERYPEVHMALTRMYPENPGTITVEMFDHMLDLEMAQMQLDIAIPIESDKEVSMYQKADVALCTKTFEHAILDRMEYKYALPLMLRALKGDQLIAKNFEYSLKQYPIFRAPRDTVFEPGLGDEAQVQLTRTDVSNELAEKMQGSIDGIMHELGRTYNLLSQVSHVEADIVNVANTYFYEPLDNVIRLAQSFNALKNFATKEGIEGIVDSLTQFAFTRLMAEVGDMTFMMDRFLQNITAPLKDGISKISKLTQTVQQISGDVGYVIDGGLKGQMKGSMCGESRTVTDPLTGDKINNGVSFVSNSVRQHVGDTMGKAESWLNGKFEGASDGLKSLAEHADWANRVSRDKSKTLQQELEKLFDRRGGEKGSLTELMCSLRALDSFVNMAKGFVKAKDSGSTSAAQPTTEQRLETVGRILTNLDTGTGTKFAIESGEVKITPPDMPEPDERVERGLRRGGLERITRNELMRVKLEGPNAQ